MTGPLGGVRVIGLEQAVAGPICTRYLLDLGADVIKVERPGIGDFARHYNGHVGGYSSYAVWLSSGKRSIAVDLKTVAGREILVKLCATADVLVSNLGPGVTERIVPDQELAERFPRLTRCYISGFGPTGPDSQRKAYDLILQGEAGITWATGTREEPTKAGVSVADLAGGLYSANLILADLVGRSSIGTAHRIDVSLFDVMVDWMTPLLLAEQYGGGVPDPSRLQHPAIMPYGAYETSDHQLVNLAVQNTSEWGRFCRTVLQDPEFGTDPDFATNIQRVEARAVVAARVEAAVKVLTASELIHRLELAQLPWGRINSPRDVLAHPQLSSPGMWSQVRLPDSQVVKVVSPLTPRDRPVAAVPRVGQDTDAILRELGYSGERLASVYQDKIASDSPDEIGPIESRPRREDNGDTANAGGSGMGSAAIPGTGLPRGIRGSG